MTPIRELKGVGEKTEKLFLKAGISTVEELLHDYPRNYDEFCEPVGISGISEGETVAILAQVASNVYVNRGGTRQVIAVTLADRTGSIGALWFHASYQRSRLKRGAVFIFRGRVVNRQNRLLLEHPEIFLPEEYEKRRKTLIPVYHLTEGLSNKTVTRMVKQCLEETKPEQDYLPESVRGKYFLMEQNEALRQIHFPESRQKLLEARKRLVFDEFLLFILMVKRLRGKTLEKPGVYTMKPVWQTEEVIEKLPYILTGAQERVWHEIERDLCSHSIMSRLVQGDVGSGKTILAFLAMILTAENAHQSALMVPTEVLANQHFEALQKLLSENGMDAFCPVLLTGSLKGKEKQRIQEMIRTGEARMVVGTHALIQEKVQYEDLALVITDEQHRFGVKQREEFGKRGRDPHVLVMSATPIPRTLAVILYGDLDISLLDELPKSRLPIKNCVVDTRYRPKAFAFLEKQVHEGRQCYVICPMVEGKDELEIENVTDYTEHLKEALPEDIQVRALHGKMKAKEKNEVMESFFSGETDILVSTTVIEVGVNVPNATVMMVENAERFGLAQLHQLRGRVGRGSWQSYCIFIQGNQDEETRRRLEILNKSNDGFFIAGEDLRLRGPGDLFGIRQSGDMEFQIADIYQDSDILQLAGNAAGEILKKDFDLAGEENRGLLRKVEECLSRRSEGFVL